MASLNWYSWLFSSQPLLWLDHIQGGLFTLALGSYSGITEWVNTALDHDLFVTTNESLAVRAFRFPASVGDELATIPGVYVPSMYEVDYEGPYAFRQCPDPGKTSSHGCIPVN